MDGSIKVWDARINNESSVIQFDSNIPFAHGKYNFTLFMIFSDLYCLRKKKFLL